MRHQPEPWLRPCPNHINRDALHEFSWGLSHRNNSASPVVLGSSKWVTVPVVVQPEMLAINGQATGDINVQRILA